MMNELKVTYKLSDEEFRHSFSPVKIMQNKFLEIHTRFRESVFKEILHNGTRDPHLITIIQNSQWVPGYSQIFYDGILQGHLYEDFVNLTFRFKPE